MARIDRMTAYPYKRIHVLKEKVQSSHFDAFYAETEVDRGAKSLSPPHVTQLRDGRLLVFQQSWLIRVYVDHLLVHILRRKINVVAFLTYLKTNLKERKLGLIR